ncbi:Kinetoplastid membrane protein 11 [Lotmaria passim]
MLFKEGIINYTKFVEYVDEMDEEFIRRMDEEDAAFLAKKPDDSLLSPASREDYAEFERVVEMRRSAIIAKLRKHSDAYKEMFWALLLGKDNRKYGGKNF